MGKAPTEGFCPRAIMDEARGTSELGVVVPTGFEPVFEPDYDFALILQRLRTCSSSQKGVRLKQEGGLITGRRHSQTAVQAAEAGCAFESQKP
jgi:hypothetical protein